MISGKKYLLGLVAGAALSMSSHAMAAEQQVLHLSNWAEYIGEDTVKNFEKKTGIKVVYDNYDSVEAIDSKLLAGHSGYDAVTHASSMIARLIKAGNILQPLDKSKLPNWKNLDPEILKKVAENWDPGNKYIVPYMWGTQAVTFNRKLLLETDPDAPIGTLDLIFKPENMKKIAKCGVAFLDSPTDMIPMALAYMGKDPASTNPADYQAVKKMLLKIRPYIKSFDNYAYEHMPQKAFCVAVTWGPDGLFAQQAADDSKTGVKLEAYVPPGDGIANLWVDGWVIPADAKNVDAALKWLNYEMDPKTAAGDANYTYYATANLAAKKQGLIDEAVTTSPTAWPKTAAVKKMYTLDVVPPRIEKLRTRVWTEFKANKQ